jgi:ankyrin repeat protein
VGRLLRGGALQQVVVYGKPLLHHAASRGHLAVVDTLISIYPDPETWHMFLMGCAAPSTLTAYLAAPSSRPHIHLPRIYVDQVMHLIWSFLHKPRYVADLDEVDSSGWTALQLSDREGHGRVSWLLCKNGACLQHRYVWPP